ncbi:MAG: DUF547 domain-containing protein [Deltaproteobacteria bacterium]|nr:DUF547 domain-containing protein [Deltaproteobacteria bacterium]
MTRNQPTDLPDPAEPASPSFMRRRRALRLILTGLFAACSRGGGKPANAASPFDHDHKAWDALLNTYVKRGRVAYGRLKQAARSELDAYLHALAAVGRPEYMSWSNEQRMAFLINAYNAATVKLVLDHYPLKSIKSIGLLPGAAFREDFITLPALADGEISLNHIEHEVLRKKFRDPRIHFAIVCASTSCPELRPEAYVARRLHAQLDDAARRFLADTGKNRYDGTSDTLFVSAIFDWFQTDFEKSAGSVTAFVKRYLPPDQAAGITPSKTRLKHLDYDWSLNGD